MDGAEAKRLELHCVFHRSGRILVFEPSFQGVYYKEVGMEVELRLKCWQSNMECCCPKQCLHRHTTIPVISVILTDYV